MTFTLPKSVVVAFLFTGVIYLIAVSFIHYPLNTLIKPIPIVCLIIGVLQSERLALLVKMVLILALGFSLIGDIVLTLPIQLTLELGIICFLLAHCCYIFLFVKHYQFCLVHLVYIVPILGLSACLFYLLFPNLGSLFIPVLIYFSVLLIMVFTAYQVKGTPLFLMIGASSFWLSDSILAYNVFVESKMDLSILVMLTYYLAQLFLVSGLVGLYRKDNELR